MSIFNKFFKKKKRSDDLAKKGFKEQRLKSQEEEKEKKELTLRELREKEARAPKVVKEKKLDTKDAYRILLKPIITEKGTYLNSQNKYIFEVAPLANKIIIKKAIWHLYGVKPLSVNIIKLPGKKIRYGRIQGRTKAKKKAIVTLKKGETIKVYEGV